MKWKGILGTETNNYKKIKRKMRLYEKMFIIYMF